MRSIARRRFLQAALGAASALPFYGLSQRSARANGGERARRLIVFYFPDGVAGRSQNGEPSLWEARPAGGDVTLSELLMPLGDLRRECVFLNGLTMGGTDEGSHPGGAKKLLTAVDGGNGESIDQYLARTVGRDAPYRHLYLGAGATQNNASGDKFISYASAGVTVAPDDDPLRAFRRMFTGAVTPPPAMMPTPDAGTVTPPSTVDDEADRLALEAALGDLNDLRGRLGTSERVKLDAHLEALREVSARLVRPPAAMVTDAGVMMAADAGMRTPNPSCAMPAMRFEAPTGAGLNAPENFPAVLRAQVDTTVLAMACGLTRVGVIQSSQHTSELIMSRFRDTDMYDARFDMRSHQASHYGARQDRSNRLFTDFVKQVRWWVSQFAYLLQSLRAMPEGDGTMLDHSVVLLCSEVSDGNTHTHSDMPFVLAGRAGGCITPGRVLERRGARHGQMLAAIARSMGADVAGWGDAGNGVLPGLLS
jgi:hypothetical protein